MMRKLIRYKTPEEVLLRYVNCEPDLPVEDLAEVTFGGDGVDELPAVEAVAGFRENLFWGFTDVNTGEIHVWFDPQCPAEKLIQFLGHEVGHNVGTPATDDAEEELRADGFGDVAREAFELWKVLTSPAV